MKKILIILVVFSVVFASCNTKDSKNVLNLDEIEETLFVIQSEVNHISSLTEPEIYYLIYAGYNDKFYPCLDNDNLSGSIDFIQSHILYKHTYLFVIRMYDDIPVIGIEPISAYLNAGEFSHDQSSYLISIFRDLNKMFVELKENGQTKDMRYDDFLISLKLIDGKVTMQYTRFMPDGTVSKPVYCEENLIKDDLALYTKHLEDCTNHLAYYENLAASKRKLIKNSDYYAEYLKRKAEHIKSQGLIMEIYNSAPYDRIKLIIDNNPEIFENADLYTKDNLQQAYEAIKDAESNIQIYKSLIEEDEKQITSLQIKLEHL